MRGRWQSLRKGGGPAAAVGSPENPDTRTQVCITHICILFVLQKHLSHLSDKALYNKQYTECAWSTVLKHSFLFFAVEDNDANPTLSANHTPRQEKLGQISRLTNMPVQDGDPLWPRPLLIVQVCAVFFFSYKPT